MTTLLDLARGYYHLFSWETAFLVCLAYFIVDALYAKYTFLVTKKKPIGAATTGAAMHFLIAFGVLSYVQNPLYIFPIVIGSWFGTYVVVKREYHKTKKFIE